jgi:hypothetical protein
VEKRSMKNTLTPFQMEGKKHVHDFSLLICSIMPTFITCTFDLHHLSTFIATPRSSRSASS